MLKVLWSQGEGQTRDVKIKESIDQSVKAFVQSQEESLKLKLESVGCVEGRSFQT